MAPHSIDPAATYNSYASSSSSEAPSDSSSVTTAPLTASRPLVPGTYVPTPCFFDSNENVDTDTISRHVTRLAQAGVAGITTQGSNGEAVHLTLEERALVTRTTRLALDAAGFTHVPVIVGCGAQSEREAIALCKQAAESGGNYVLVLPPSYYKAAMNRDALMHFFTSVADFSPLPVMVYNYPGAAAGIDLDSEFLEQLGHHPNVVGAKLTCGNVGKLARLAASMSAVTPLSKRPTEITSHPFLVLAGSSDFFLPALIVQGSGALAGLANVAPKTHAALLAAFRAGDMPKAQELQGILARADFAVQKGGVVGTKYLLQSAFGYGGFARRPLGRWSKEEIKANEEAFQEILKVEESL